MTIEINPPDVRLERLRDLAPGTHCLDMDGDPIVVVDHRVEGVRGSFGVDAEGCLWEYHKDEHAIIAGRSEGGSRSSAFYPLEDLEPGDKVQVLGCVTAEDEGADKGDDRAIGSVGNVIATVRDRRYSDSYSQGKDASGNPYPVVEVEGFFGDLVVFATQVELVD